MNGAEQRQRFTAVARAEKRLDDLETVIEGLAGEMVKDREAAAARCTDLERVVVIQERDLARLRALAHQSVWSRVRAWVGR